MQQFTIVHLGTGLQYNRGGWAEEPEFLSSMEQANRICDSFPACDLPVEIKTHEFSPVELGLV